LSAGISGIASMGSGVMMLSNGFDQLTDKLASGEASFQDFAVAAMSIGPGLL
jgi:hypothetical protein